MFDMKKRIKKAMDKLLHDSNAVGGTLMLVVVAAVTLVILAVILELGPVIGYQTSNAVSIPATSQWNTVTNSAITNGTEIWGQNTPMVSVTTIAIFAGLIIAVLLTIVGGNRGNIGGGGV